MCPKVISQWFNDMKLGGSVDRHCRFWVFEITVRRFEKTQQFCLVQKISRAEFFLEVERFHLCAVSAALLQFVGDGIKFVGTEVAKLRFIIPTRE